MNIAEVLEKDIQKYGEYMQWVFPEEGIEYTNIECDRLAKKFANGLQGLGVKKGDRLIVLSHTCPEIIVTFLACFKAGVIVNAAIQVLSPEEIAYILNDAGTVVVVTNAELYRNKIEKIRADVPSLKHVILTDEKLPDTLLFKDIVDNCSDDFKVVPADDDDVALLVYTSGTTGNPKGVMKTEHNLFFEFYSSADIYLDYGMNSQDLTSLMIMPLSHIWGVLILVCPSALGNKNIVLRKYDVEKCIDAIKKYDINLISGVPTMVTRLLAHPEGEKVLRERKIYWELGGAPVPLELVKTLNKIGHVVIASYGMTEEGTATQDCARRPYDVEKRPGSIGLPILPGVEVRVFDENDNEVPIGRVGELVFRGPGVMKGYWNKSELTAKALRGGWMHSGDLGYRDRDGYFYIGSRKDDLIIRGGNNIYPEEIENVLYTHPKVKEASVIGVPDQIYGEEIKAFVTLKPGEKATAQELIEYSRPRLAKYKIPKYLEIIEAMPLNSPGKILKRELRKRGEKATS